MEIRQVLKNLGIQYKEVEHPPVFTAEDAQFIKKQLPGIGCKSLFLTDAHKEKYLLVCLDDSQKANLRRIAKIAGFSRLSFASPEELYELVKLRPGGVTPFGIINDEANRVILVIDEGLQGQTLLCHPDVNTRTISFSCDDLIRFIKAQNHEYLLLPRENS